MRGIGISPYYERVRTSNGLFTDHGQEVPDGLPLVMLFTGFIDAGNSVRSASRHIMDHLEHTLVLSFDNDSFLDYRARRPTFVFEQTRLTDYRPPTLTLSLVTDDMGAQFLLLAGYEPDFRWDSAIEIVLDIIERFRVSHTTWAHAIPMPVPHTRPVGMTVSGSRAELVDAYSVWKPTTEIPGTFGHLVEYTLCELGFPVAGFVILIPHYLADSDFPFGAVAVFDAITTATGIMLPTDEFRESGREFLAGIAEQIEDNEELQRMIVTLENRHDTYMDENPLPSPLTDAAGEVPTADAIAAELERFLRTRPGDAD